MTDLIARISGQAGQGSQVALLDVDRLQLDELLNIGKGESIIFNKIFFMHDANNGVIGKQVYSDIEFTWPTISRPIRLVYFIIEKTRYYVNLE